MTTLIIQFIPYARIHHTDTDTPRPTPTTLTLPVVKGPAHVHQDYEETRRIAKG